MRLRRFSDSGLGRFASFLDSLTTDADQKPPFDLLEDGSASESITPKVEIDVPTFETRFAAAKYLYEKFIAAGLGESQLDRRVWAWLTLLWFEQLRPAADQRRRQWPGERARWIPAASHDWKTFYRHLLAAPWRVYRFHSDNPDRALVLLCGKLHTPGEVSEQLLSRQEIVTNRGLIELATRLYYDSRSRKIRRGAAAKTGGSIRRYADFINQFGVTWDLYAMTADQVQRLLPEEFEPFVRVRA